MNIDAKLNAAYVLMGLLYGEGDFELSMRIAMQCGQDSDCNPSTVGGVLGNFYGYEKISGYINGLDETGTKFYATEYSFGDAVNASFKLAKDIITARGGVVKPDGNVTVFVSEPEKVLFEQWPDRPAYEYSITAEGSAVKLSLQIGRAHV